jgi:hypothetical protein
MIAGPTMATAQIIIEGIIEATISRQRPSPPRKKPLGLSCPPMLTPLCMNYLLGKKPFRCHRLASHPLGLQSAAAIFPSVA